MKQRYFILSLLLCFSFFMKAQVTEAEAEAAFVNFIKSSDYQAYIPLAQQQVRACENEVFSEKLITAYSHLAFALQSAKDSTWTNYADKAITLAATQYNDPLHPSASWANWAKAFSLRDTQEDLELMSKVLAKQQDKKESYFLLCISYIDGLTEVFLQEELVNQVAELEKLFDQRQDLQPFKFALFYGKTNLALLQENHEQVIVYSKQILALEEESPLFWQELKNRITNRLIAAYGQLGQFKEAKALCFELIKNTDDSHTLGLVYLNLSSLFDLEPNLEQAILYAELAIVEMRKTNAGNLGVALYNLATSKLRYNDLVGAKEDMQEAFLYLPPAFHFALFNLEGRILAKEHNYALALEAAQKALLVVCTSFDVEAPAENPTIFDTYVNRGWAVHILYRKGLYQAALARQSGDVALMRQAQKTVSLTKALATDGLSDLRGFELSQYFSISNRFVNSALELETQLFLDYYHLNSSKASLQSAFLALEKKKAAGLVKSIAEPQLPENFSIRLETIQKNLVQAQYKVEIAQEDSLTYYQDALLSSSQEMKEVVEELQRNYPLESDYFYAIPYVNLDQTKALLPAGAALLNFFLSEEEAYVFVLTQKGEEIVTLPVENVDELKEKVNRYMSLLPSPLIVQRTPKEEFIMLGHELYEQLVAPLKHAIVGQEKLIIIPDNGLFELPFESLLTKPVGVTTEFNEMPFLLVDYQVSYQYSATAYALLKKKDRIKNQSLLAFAPVFEYGTEVSSTTKSLPFVQDTLMRSMIDDTFSPLPASRREVKMIRDILPEDAPKVILLDSAATKSKLLTAIANQSYQYIHIATHGFANLEDVRHSGLACSTSSDSSEELLFINEVQFSPIRADLVVLSSCDSGIGQFAGNEGMLAFNRAFIYAGANNVISSLWRISDRYSSELMIQFYTFLAQGDDYSTALRKTKLILLSNTNTALPRYWSPFILMGE